LPVRAHPPIVAGRKETFEARRSSAASDRVIQSDAAGIDDQPPSDAGEAAGFDGPDFDDPDDPEPDSARPEPAEPDDAPSADGVDLEESAGFDSEPPSFDSEAASFDSEAPSFESLLEDRAAVRRSILAQPDPLKTTAGAAMPLRIVASAPQAGQKLGPVSKIPCRISAR